MLAVEWKLLMFPCLIAGPRFETEGDAPEGDGSGLVNQAVVNGVEGQFQAVGDA